MFTSKIYIFIKNLLFANFKFFFIFISLSVGKFIVFSSFVNKIRSLRGIKSSSIYQIKFELVVSKERKKYFDLKKT